MSLVARLIKHLPATRNSPSFTLDLQLEAHRGITALFGPSGAGKSLSLNCIGGFVRPDEGRILLDDEIYFDGPTGVHLAPRVRRCGYIFQDHALFPHMTVRENLQFASGLARTTAQKPLNRRRRITELLESFELTELASRRAAQLSGGQKQRAALARILISEPRLLLLDEPSRGLDNRLRESFYRVLDQIRQRLNIPVLLVTHELDECFRLADSIYLLEEGKLIEAGAASSLFHRPQTLAAARALGIFNLFPAEITALDPGRNTSRLRILAQEIEGPYLPGHLLGDRGHICLRESETEVLPPGVASPGNTLTLDVVGSEETPSGTRLHFADDLRATLRASSASLATQPDQFTLRIPPHAIHFLS